MFKTTIFSALLVSSQAFAPIQTTGVARTTALSDSRIPIEGGSSFLEQSNSPIDAFLEDIKTRIRIGQESNAAGFGGKQVMADVIAGEYDEDSVRIKLNEQINSAPCGTFRLDASALILVHSCIESIFTIFFTTKSHF